MGAETSGDQLEMVGLELLSSSSPLGQLMPEALLE